MLWCLLIGIGNWLYDDGDDSDNDYDFNCSFTEKEIPLQTSQLYKNPDSHSRKVHEQALTGMFGKLLKVKVNQARSNVKVILYISLSRSSWTNGI